MRVEVKSALISAAVAFAVAAPLSNAANNVGHTAIKVVKGKQGKRGPRGLRGPVGPTGPRGPKGDPGPNTLGDGEFALNPPRGTVTAGTERTFAAYCPNHDTTGGFFETTADTPPTPVRSGVSADATYYYVTLKAGVEPIVVTKTLAYCSG